MHISSFGLAEHYGASDGQDPTQRKFLGATPIMIRHHSTSPIWEMVNLARLGFHSKTGIPLERISHL